MYFTSAFLTSAAFLPQAIRTLRKKATRDLSRVMLTTQSTGNLAWMLYLRTHAQRTGGTGLSAGARHRAQAVGE
ncbi:MAG: PQ-loop repeat-containing protein [Verrucomicrobia bacterium]|nr:PQ-loop repeat-containing protein [Verrucomicrobiota bacterium]MBT7068922.1 PQ-loop repeat-containing protein [Verrucomicrobiota bacterium]MBT7701842.1 PQ-loop repeat-containing protein [Verrucomicrobiota bacterium]